jgi:hypothetical protein
MKTIGLFVLAMLVLIAVAVISYKAAETRSRSEIILFKGEADIYRNQMEKYAQALRRIRETASTVTVTEKAR